MRLLRYGQYMIFVKRISTFRRARKLLFIHAYRWCLLCIYMIYSSCSFFFFFLLKSCSFLWGQVTFYDIEIRIPKVLILYQNYLHSLLARAVKYTNIQEKTLNKFIQKHILVKTEKRNWVKKYLNNIRGKGIITSHGTKPRANWCCSFCGPFPRLLSTIRSFFIYLFIK